MDVGTRFVVNVVPKGLRNVTKGKQYVIAGRDIDDEPYFVDDAGRDNFAVGHPHGYLETRRGMYTILTD